MTTFDSREKAFENKFAHDEEMVFKARARRNRLFGEWLAAEMGLSGDQMKEYAGAVVAADLEEEGDDDVIRKVVKDAEENNLGLTAQELEAKLHTFMPIAQEQIMSEVK